MDSSEVSFLSGLVLLLFLFGLFTALSTGLQAYFHLAQFRGERGQGNEIGQRPYPRYDSGHNGFLGLCSYAGSSDV
jgi:hypothetical protein